LIRKVDACGESAFGRDRRNAFLHDLLRIGLPRVDDVVDLFAAAEFRMRLDSFSAGRYPNLAARIASTRQVVEIEAKDAELTHLVGDIFAGVSYRSVRTYEYLVGFVFVGSGMFIERHHPTAGVLGLALKTH